ncbi:MAG: pyridoxamine 5'-phosphate oxidase family protein [Deltaproteobacteria bacterium]
MELAMTKQEREAFLAEAHIGIMSVDWQGRGPLTVPIWYDYEPGGEIVILTTPGSRKAKLLDRTGRFTLCAQTETPPYKYTSVEGPVVSVTAADVERDSRPMARRYLGDELGDAYVEETSDQDGDAVAIRMRPERWKTVDYSKQYGNGG